MGQKIRVTAFIASMLAANPAHASETTTYTYDALGRLVQVSHSGSVNNGVTESYAFDKASNRTQVQVMSNAPQSTCGFSVSDAAVPSFGGAPLSFIITKQGSCSSVLINYQTSNGSASAGTSYVAMSGSIVFESSEFSKIILVPTYYNDNVNHPELDLFLSLSIASGSAQLVPSTSSTWYGFAHPGTGRGYFYDAS